MNKTILWLIPARAGSKSIPNKNIKILGNYPLLIHRFLNAKQCKFSSEIWLSTNSEQYSEIAKSYGINVPFLRPDYLSSDTSSSNDVVLHAIEFAESKKLKFDLIGLLEPTSPFITSENLELAVFKLLEDKEAESIVSVRESRPAKIFIQQDDLYLNEIYNNIKSINKVGRQFFKKEVTPSGGLYISKWENFKINKSFYTQKTLSIYVDDISGLEIDEPLDWEFAEFIINKKLKNEL